MNSQSGNLSRSERAVSAGLATALSLIAIRGGSPLLRLLSGIAAAGLAARAAAGHCAVKAALRGQASLGEALSDEWRSLADRSRMAERGCAGSPLHRQNSARVDEAVRESFPASDPPASRLPDEPPVNADAKWAAAKAAGMTN